MALIHLEIVYENKIYYPTLIIIFLDPDILVEFGSKYFDRSGSGSLKDRVRIKILLEAVFF